jgi:hypothetical protein
MRWIKIANRGCFDVVAAVNMLGASVKVNDNPIGMFGSGTKFALAQIARSNIEAKIYDGRQMFNVKTSRKTFRDKAFDMVSLNNIQTPITTEFGGQDWKDDWFIFREFYANAVDEGNHSISIVDDIIHTDGETAVFLPYYRFKEYYDNINKYFIPRNDIAHCSGNMWVGDGSAYRQGVFIGKLEGTTLNLHSSNLEINECRTMNVDVAYAYYSAFMGVCCIKDNWVAFFQSSDEFKKKMNFSITSDRHGKIVHEALTEVYGENYCICPNVNDIVRDATSLGMYPVVLPSGITIQNKNVRDYANLENASMIREMNESEKRMYDKVRNKISAFISKDIQINVRVFSEGIDGIGGNATLGTINIGIRDTSFSDERTLMHVIIHEIGHIVTKVGDYDRRFVAFFIDKLVDIAM